MSKAKKRTFALPENEIIKHVKKYKKTPEKEADAGAENRDDSGLLCTPNASVSVISPSGSKKRKPKNPKMKASTPKCEARDIKSMDISQLLTLGEGINNCVGDASGGNTSSGSDEEEEEWEDVEMAEEVKPTDPVISKEGVNIVLEMPQINSFKRKKKGFDLEAHIKRQMNQVKRELQLLMHKVHVLCWIAHLRFVNSVLNSEILMATSLSLISNNNLYPPKHADLSYLERILKWFHNTIILRESEKHSVCAGGLSEELMCQFKEKTAFNKKYFVFMFILLLRTLGLKTRLVMSFQVVPIRPKSIVLGSDQCDDNKSNCSKTSKKNVSGKNVKSEENQSGYFSKKNSTPSQKSITKDEKSPRLHEDLSQVKVKDERKSISGSSQGETSKHFASLPKQSVRSKNSKVKAKERVNDKGGNGKRVEEISNVSGTVGKCNSTPTGKKARGEKGPNTTGASTPKVRTRKGNKTDADEGKSSGGNPGPPKRTTKKVVKRKSKKNDIMDKAEESSDTDSDFVPQSLKKNSSPSEMDKRASSSDEEEQDSKKRHGCDIWAEVFLESEEKWFCLDAPRQKIHCVNELYSRASQPVAYVVAANTDSTLKDVTKRYVPNWHSDTRKRRVDDNWWNETMWPYAGPKTPQDREEDEDISQQLMDKPLPSSISQYKDHPLYALKRHLLKFEGIYPPNAPTLGFVRGEPVYARECVVTLRSREVWYKEARVVRLKEQPYKIVKARPKFDKMTGEIKKDLPLELYGMWQTEEYIPPVAHDGKVPRNEYGNVDLFKSCMLPKGTVHLKIPSLNKVAKKLGIDCAPAIVGFDFHCGASHPITDGFVVCEEVKDVLLDAWNKEMDDANKKSEEKRLKRIYDNWKRLIRGLAIREKLKVKYAFGDEKNDRKPSSSEKRT